jgi:gluconate 2-dehydrogenase gamma chain
VQQDDYLRLLEAGARDLGGFSSAIFFETLLANTIEGYFADPAYGGNRDKAGWRMIGFPGAQAAYLGLYTHHGMRFPGEPLAMDEAGAANARHR